MTGWYLLEYLANLADNTPDELDENIWIGINSNYAQPNEINYTYDKLSQKGGLFIKYERN